MTHVSERQLDELSAGELRPHEADAVRAHVAACAVCARRAAAFATDERALADMLRALDTPAPPVDAATVIRRVHRRRAMRRRLWVAAATALVTTGAFALPGPLRRALGPRPRATAPPPAAVARPTPDSLGAGDRAGRVSGVAIVPGDSAVIRFDVPQRAGMLRVLVAPGNELVLRATDVAGAPAAFSVGATTVRVRNQDAGGSYELAVPASTATVRVLVGDREAFAMLRGIAAARYERDERGAYVVHLR